MGMKLDGQEFKIKMTPEAIGGKDGKRSFIGETEEEKNLIVIDGTLEPSRQEEVLLHELLHICDDGMPEFMVKNISVRLHGFLTNNDLLKPGMIKKMSDGMLSKDEMEKLNKESQEMAEHIEEMGMRVGANYAVSELPWNGEPGSYTEPDGRINRVAVHYAARDLVSGRLEPKQGTRKAMARNLIHVYENVLKEKPPFALILWSD